MHKTKKGVENGPLDKHLRRQLTHIDSRYKIYLQLAHFTATSNLSLQNGCSDELFRIIYSALDYYKNNYQQFNNTPVERIVPKIGPVKMREIIIDSANKILSNTIESLRYSRYISICLDGGQVSKRHFIDFVVWTKKASFSVFIKDTESLNADGYAKLALECLNDEKMTNIQNKIVCFVGDGLRAQVAGLDPESAESFQHKNRVGVFF